MVRVLIERWLKEGSEHAFNKTIRELLREAVPASGYISGETLRDAMNPQHFIVISSWNSRKDWDMWAVSEVRGTVRKRIEPMLAAAERITILEPA